jgi:cephalosporin-C deacetylase-like acetyl esterase
MVKKTLIKEISEYREKEKKFDEMWKKKYSNKNELINFL